MNTYNEEQASSHEKLVVHINDDDYQQLPSSGSFRRQQHRHSEMLGKTPCPSIVYECLPPAMLNDPADAMFSIQQASLVGDGELGNDDSDSTGELTQGYFNCLQQHGGKSIWNHPDQPCNTCRCTATGSIACTKMLCIPDKQDTSAHGDIVPDILTTIMSPVPAPADADPENTSQFYTSIVIDVKA
ncbi:hypothetical protein FB645_000591 [Coemansia sp. IMI 203386]|nr:hypothetical protein FB645_000591 [Coemansia sp. IMI 203386]